MLSADDIKRAAREAGFTLCGLARAEPLPPEALTRWLAQGMHGTMGWMAETAASRLDPTKVLPGARTVVALASCFATAENAGPGVLSRYARGRDYHATLKDRLRALRRALLALNPSLTTYHEVDTGPVMEKAWAERAGLGWIGKNGLLLTREHGSHVMLAVMLLDEEADAYDAPHAFFCGSCTLCLEGCPTQAIVQPGVVDARRCLSYVTIEDRDTVAEESLRPATAGMAFGCDLCQKVCPWTPDSHACVDARFTPREVASLSLFDLATLTFERWDALTRGTAVARARYDGLRRNALLAMGAGGDPRTREAAEPLLSDASPLVREAARWALARVAS